MIKWKGTTMDSCKKSSYFLFFALPLIGLLAVLPTKGIANQEGNFPLFFADDTLPGHSASGDPLSLGRFASYPADPSADIPWSCTYSGVDQIQCAFNNARSAENTQLGTSLPMLTFPSQAIWDAMNQGEQALWIINRERDDRGMKPLEQIESNVTGVAQTYADFLLDNDAWGHTEDGRTPWERLDDNPEIWACHDFLNVAENLAVFVSTGSIPLPVVRSVYMWMYDDAGSAWGHRHAILWNPYNDNSGLGAMEGFLGIGRASGGPYQGPFSGSWPNAEMIVMNVFDPCSTWEYGSTTSSSTSSSTTSSVSSTTTTAATSSSTTSSAISSSTTTSIEDDAFFECPSEHLYGDYSEEVYLLRKFRDNVLSSTPEGKQLIDLYYTWSPLVFKAMVEDEELKSEIRIMLDGILLRIKKSLR